MKKRNIVAVLLLPFVTFGIYSIYWSVVTKNEMNALGAKIPTAWLLIVPFVNIWWLWKHSEGVEQVTAGKTQGVLAFILQWFLGSIGQAIIQDGFNKIGEAAPVAAAPAPAPEAPATENLPPETPVPPAAV
jgi:hypothetical protein